MSSKVLEQPKTTPYDEDFYLWLMEQAEHLRQGHFNALDLENLAEEVESIGRSDKREVQSRLIVLLAHLLKYQFQPGRRSHSWRATIGEQRRQLDLVFKDSPSLLKHAPDIFDESYRYARRKASDETRLSLETFPDTCPYSLEQILNEDFFPEG
ncbi:DUF29 domain-containing protein [soil metagenome]